MDLTDSKYVMIISGRNTNRLAGSTPEASVPCYRWISSRDGTGVFLASWRIAEWDNAFIPTGYKYTLPSRGPPISMLRAFVVQDPGISAREFFEFAYQIGPIYRAYYTQRNPQVRASVTYVLEEHTRICLDELLCKGYRAGIVLVGAPYALHQGTPGTETRCRTI